MDLERIDDNERRISEIDRRLKKLEQKAESIKRVDEIDARLRQLEHEIRGIAPDTSRLIMMLQALCDRILITRRDIGVHFTLNGDERTIMWDIRGNHDFYGLINKLVKAVIREKEEGTYNDGQEENPEEQEDGGRDSPSSA